LLPGISIPSVIAHLNLAVFYEYRELSGRLVSWRGQCCAGADAKACAVARANDLVTFGGAADELSTIMGVDVFDGVLLAGEVEHRDLRVVHLCNPPFSWLDLCGPRYRDPFTHFNPSFRKFRFGAHAGDEPGTAIEADIGPEPLRHDDQPITHADQEVDVSDAP
jgi:hypothetical protein